MESTLMFEPEETVRPGSRYRRPRSGKQARYRSMKKEIERKKQDIKNIKEEVVLLKEYKLRINKKEEEEPKMIKHLQEIINRKHTKETTTSLFDIEDYKTTIQNLSSGKGLKRPKTVSGIRYNKRRRRSETIRNEEEEEEGEEGTNETKEKIWKKATKTEELSEPLSDLTEMDDDFEEQHNFDMAEVESVQSIRTESDLDMHENQGRLFNDALITAKRKQSFRTHLARPTYAKSLSGSMKHKRTTAEKRPSTTPSNMKRIKKKKNIQKGPLTTGQGSERTRNLISASQQTRRHMTTTSSMTHRVNTTITPMLNTVLDEKKKEEEPKKKRKRSMSIRRNKAVTLPAEEVDEHFYNDLLNLVAHAKKQNASTSVIDGSSVLKEIASERKRRKSFAVHARTHEIKMEHEQRPASAKVKVRSIEDQLKQLRKNKNMRAELADRVQEYKNEKTTKSHTTNHIQKYVKSLANKDPEVFAAEKERKQEERTAYAREVYHYCRMHHANKMMVRREKLEENNHKRHVAEIRRAILPAQRAIDKRTQVLAPAIYLSLFASNMKVILDKARKRREHQDKVKHSLKTMSKYLSPIITIRRAARQAAAYRVIQRNILIFSLNHRIRKKKHAVRVISSCVGSLEDSNRFSKQVAMFLHRIRSCQQYARLHLSRRRAQVSVLKVLWKRVEGPFLIEQKENDWESFKETIRTEIQILESSMNDEASPDNVASQMKSTSDSVVQDKKTLKKLFELAFSKRQLSSKTFAQRVAMLHNPDLDKSTIKKIGEALSIYPRERFKIDPMVRDNLIYENLIERSQAWLRQTTAFKAYMEATTEERSSMEEPTQASKTFKYIPEDEDIIKRLIERAQDVSKMEVQERTANVVQEEAQSRASSAKKSRPPSAASKKSRPNSPLPTKTKKKSSKKSSKKKKK
mmetsp:Transcript_5619/g.8273  ORF Transcript_5619/g.8273 Transcript_5619/m.8273 type:complete len:916 (+) Transcript_5619:108-2855(+)